MKNNLRHSACRGTQYAACPYDPNRENVVPERPQTLRHYEIINSISDDHAQSNAERILNRSARRNRNKKLPHNCAAVFVPMVYSITAPVQGRRPWR